MLLEKNFSATTAIIILLLSVLINFYGIIKVIFIILSLPKHRNYFIFITIYQIPFPFLKLFLVHVGWKNHKLNCNPQFKIFFLIWISRSFKKGPRVPSVILTSRSDSLASDLFWPDIWGDLVRISRGEQRENKYFFFF